MRKKQIIGIVCTILIFATSSFSQTNTKQNVTKNNIPITQSQDNNLIAPLCHGHIGDYVWHDEDADGVQDASEIGIEL